MTATVVKLPVTRVRACDRFVPGKETKFCVCGFGRHAHSRDALVAGKYKFRDVWCSSCGRSFGPGDNGYSVCDEHAHRDGEGK